MSGDKYKHSNLENYHLVFRSGAPADLRVRAAEGMAAFREKRLPSWHPDA